MMNKKKLLIIEAHSDDSCISIGGFLERFKEEYEYHFFLTAVSSVKLYHTGVVSRQDRMKEYENFITAFNGIWHRCESVPFDFDSQLDKLAKREIVTAIEQVISTVQPHILIC